MEDSGTPLTTQHLARVVTYPAVTVVLNFLVLQKGTRVVTGQRQHLGAGNLGKLCDSVHLFRVLLQICM